MDFWPRKLTFQNITINSLWSLIAGFVWSILILIITIVLSNALPILDNFQTSNLWYKTTAIFPIVLSIITLIWTTTTIILTYIIANFTNSERYKKNIVILWQITFFAILTYLFITPIYIYAWLQQYDYIMIIFLFHTLIVVFWTSIILELLNNYRYVLIWVYWSFIWLFISIIITFFVFNSFTTWFAKLVSLIVLLPIINFTTTFFKQLFEFTYYYYNKFTNQDPLWDIFYQVEMEENELLKLEEEKNSV